MRTQNSEVRTRFRLVAILCVLCAAVASPAFAQDLQFSADEMAGLATAQPSHEMKLTAAAPQACPATVCLAWDASPSAASTPGLTYNVYRSSVAGGCAAVTAATCTRVNAAPVTALAFNDATTAAGRRFYTVRAEADTVLSAPSNELQVLLPPLPPANFRTLP